MSRISAAWGAMAVGPRLLAIAGLVVPLALVVVLSAAALSLAAASGPAAGASPSPDEAAALPTDAPTPSPTPWPSLAAGDSAQPSASGSAQPSPPVGPDPLLGTDGRLTVLLLGSDYRPAHPGNRTDAIMIVSVDPTTGQSAAFSVPRDTVDFPLPNGGAYHTKVNGLYQYLQTTTGRGAAGMERAVGKAFGIEVDNYVFIGFSGVQALVGAVGGVDVTLAKPYYDAHYWVNGHHQGWGLPAGRSHLNAQDALIFARSRKGDSDYGRAGRQQQLVMAAFTKVLKRGVSDLPALLRIAKDTVRTDLPLVRVADLFKLYATADLDGAKRVVFGPRKYESQAGGTNYVLKLKECRAWIAKNFPPVRANGTWPATTTATD
jgi:LCP family protein required for cell wall assembly